MEQNLSGNAVAIRADAGGLLCAVFLVTPVSPDCLHKLNRHLAGCVPM